ncbi:MAG TPA: acetoacetate--CoA ligase [Chloroflexota bacterium]|nr:acetoacetate--CoA ligase [Chloroflexota bacterium]
MSTAVEEGALLWEPSEEFKQQSVVAEYMRWLATHKSLQFGSYDELWQWSVTELEGFWASLVEFLGIVFDRPWQRVLAERTMPGARWFEGAEINYTENVFRHASGTRPALISRSETRPLEELSWAELERQVASVAAWLRSNGVGKGDRVVAYMPNIPETVVAFLAAASLGAVWSSCSPDFGTEAVLDRFGQIEPKVLFAVDGYSYGGKLFDKMPVVRELQQGLPSVTCTVLLPYAATGTAADLPNAVEWQAAVSARGEPLRFEPLPFEHPLWVLYSSGTTGLPKALVHPVGGTIVELSKQLAMHCDLRAGDRLFWYSSTGWMMWNFIVSGLLLGTTTVLYDGNPGYPDMEVLWRFAEQARVKLFGTSAAYVTSCLKAGLNPSQRFDLSALRCLASTGSPLPPEGFAWAYDCVKRDLWLVSVSGGTDVVSAFVGGCPLLPVHAGELQARALGVKMDAFDEQGNSVRDQLGELVVTEPMPSMPVFLWNDPDGSRYRESYFEMYPGVWRHGDWVKITRRGTCVIQGRSDSTLNRLGVRIGTSEVYSAVEALPEVADSLIIGLELPNGGYYMPLFVMLQPGARLDDALRERIKLTIRGHFSPRHVPDEIIAVAAIPRTLSNKKMEVPVKRLFMGVPLDKAAKIGATSNPRALEDFQALARRASPLLV